ncbi:MAG: hypothetical protein ACTSPD_20965 [Promethearchaeota archaeon]
MNDYKEIILKYIRENTPRILSLMDRNKYSKTFGCFDREYWHYKSKPFFNGMNQCYILSLALLYTTKFEDNYLYKNHNLKTLILGALRFSILNSHKDGSFDEHYYNEHSNAATAFALYSITETILLLGLKLKIYNSYLRKAADFLIKNKEYFIRSNHIAGKILALYNVFLILNEKKYKFMATELLYNLLQKRSKEGWFIEYKGCDPGYLTFTLSFLVKYAEKSQNRNLKDDLKESLIFCSNFLHPDGSYSGNYGSRNNMHFLPYGIEKINTKNELGKKMVNSFLISLNNGTVEIMSDDRFNFFLFNDLLQMFSEFKNNRTKDIFNLQHKEHLFNEAGIFIIYNENYNAILSLKKGGILYIFKNNKLVFRNCGIIGKTRKAYFNSNGFQNINYSKTKQGFKIWGRFKKYRPNQTVNPLTSIIQNLFNIIFGHIPFIRNLFKKYLIKLYIIKEKRLNMSFSMNIRFLDKIYINIIIVKKKKINVKELKISSYFPNIYIPSGEFFQKNDVICEDFKLIKEMNELNRNNKVKFNLTI